MRKTTLKSLRTILLSCCTIGSLTTLKAQDLEWVKQVGGPNFDDSRGIATDAAGNVYTIGRFKQTADFDPGPGVFNLTATGSYYNTYVVKLDAAGTFIWAKHFEGAGTEPKAVAVDSIGNVFITGFKGPTGGATDFDPGPGVTNLTVTGAISNTDVFIVKLDSSGNLTWARQLGGTSTDQSSSIAVDNMGNVYTTGYFRGTSDFNPGAAVNSITAGNTSGDVFISKLDAAGNYLWAKNIGGTGSASCSATVIKSDNYGNIYLSGSFGGTIDFDPGAGVQTLATVMGEFAYLSNMFICKLNADGNYIWAKNAGSSTSPTGSSCMMALDNYGSIYLAGGFSDTVDFDPGTGVVTRVSTLTGVGDLDIFLSKLDTAGNFIWVKQMGGIGSESGRPLTDRYGNIFIIGRFVSTVDFDPSATGVFDMNSSGLTGAIFISKLDSAGNFQWAVNVDANGNSMGINGFGVALNLQDNAIHITGDFTNTIDFDPGINVTNLTASTGSGDAFIFKLKNCSPLSSTLNIAACESYTWNDSTYTESGAFSKNFLSVTGCDSTAFLELTINQRPDAGVSQTGNLLSANTSGGSYQWIDCANNNANIAGATSQTYSATASGSYAVIITRNGCSDTSICYTVGPLSIRDINTDYFFKAYPNPVHDGLTVTTTKILKNGSLRLVNILGQTLIEQTMLNGSRFHLDLNKAAKGTYILEIIEDVKISRIKIIKE